MRLQGKTALITGGARGIGAAIAAAYVREGARVCVADILEAEAAETAQRIGNGSFSCRLDVTKQDSIAACVSEVEQHAGGIDILVSNAAIFDMAPIGEITEQSFDRVFSINVKGLLFTLQAVAQDVAPPTHTAILLSLESVFCAIAGAVWLGEELGVRQVGGAALLLAAALLAQLPSSSARGRNDEQQRT